MVAPTLPTQAPPIWASNANYSLGPDASTPTKVDSGSVAPNGHIAGANFPTTAQEQNHWQHHASNVLGFYFDSIGLTGGVGDDPRAMVTSALGIIDPDGLFLWGITGAGLHTFEALAAPSGIHTASIMQGSNGAAALELYSQGSGSEDFMLVCDGTAGSSGGIHIDLDDPNKPGIEIDIASAAGLGNGVGIDVRGGDGDGGNQGGTAIVAIGGVDGGSDGGIGLAVQGGVNSPSVYATTVLTGSAAAVEAIAQGANNLGGDYTSFENIGLKTQTGFGATAGAPFQIVPQFDEPKAGLDEPGMMWISQDLVLDQFDLRCNLGDTTPRRRWLPSYEQQYCRLVVTSPDSETNADETTPTDWVDNVQFPEGMRPVAAGLDVLVTFTAFFTRSGIDTNDDLGLVAQVVIYEGATAIMTINVARAPTFQPVGSPSAGTAVTWGDRPSSESDVYVCHNFPHTLLSAGANDFRVTLARGSANGGTVIMSRPMLKVETIR